MMMHGMAASSKDLIRSTLRFHAHRQTARGAASLQQGRGQGEGWIKHQLQSWKDGQGRPRPVPSHIGASSPGSLSLASVYPSRKAVRRTKGHMLGCSRPMHCTRNTRPRVPIDRLTDMLAIAPTHLQTCRSIDSTPQGRGVHPSHFQHEEDLDHYHPHHLQHKKLRHLKLSWKARLWLTFEEPEFRYAEKGGEKGVWVRRVVVCNRRANKPTSGGQQQQQPSSHPPSLSPHSQNDDDGGQLHGALRLLPPELLHLPLRRRLHPLHHGAVPVRVVLGPLAQHMNVSTCADGVRSPPPPLS